MCKEVFDRLVSVFVGQNCKTAKLQKKNKKSATPYQIKCRTFTLILRTLGFGRFYSIPNMYAQIIFVFNFVMTKWMALNWILQELLLDKCDHIYTATFCFFFCIFLSPSISLSRPFLDILLVIFSKGNQQQITNQRYAIIRCFTMSHLHVARVMGTTFNLFPLSLAKLKL